MQTFEWAKREDNYILVKKLGQLGQITCAMLFNTKRSQVATDVTNGKRRTEKRRSHKELESVTPVQNYNLIAREETPEKGKRIRPCEIFPF